jgi:hypothetical protein
MAYLRIQVSRDTNTLILPPGRLPAEHAVPAHASDGTAT